MKSEMKKKGFLVRKMDNSEWRAIKNQKGYAAPTLTTLYKLFKKYN